MRLELESPVSLPFADSQTNEPPMGPPRPVSSTNSEMLND